MARTLELLNTQTHQLLRLRPDHEAAPHFVQVVAAEFAAAATRCPILFTKNAETGQFYAGAMYGFKPGENLLERDSGDVRLYRPLDLERQGFFISDENIAIDRSYAGFDENEGEPLFEPDGAPSERLRHIQRALGQLKTGVEETDAFIQMLLKHRLVEAIDISLRFDDVETLTLQGLYTIGLDSLRELDDTVALDLFRRGYLQLAYCMIGSLKQITLLAQRRNQRLASSPD